MVLPLVLLGCMATLSTSAEPTQARIVSPEVHPDRTVTFRLRATNAQKVEVGVEGYDNAAMTKGSDGVWSYTSPPLAADIYGYAFTVDGTTTLDPNNPLRKPNLIWQSNMVLVPGNPPEAWEVQDVPHGEIHRHFYRSKVIGDQRDFFVYTPPGYDRKARRKLPVLYLLHGFSDTADGWTAVGKANVIIDNLIAQGKAKPMLIVMTLGYGVPDFASPDLSSFRSPDRVKQNYDRYRDALFTEVIPTVEMAYGTATDKANRAIAGLSMGGAESLYVGLNAMDKFGSIGAFSTGGLAQSPEANFPSLKADDVNKLRLLYISCGTEDGLIGMNRGLRDWLAGKGAKFEYVETPGRHAWMVWRRNLIAFTSKIFR